MRMLWAAGLLLLLLQIQRTQGEAGGTGKSRSLRPGGGIIPGGGRGPSDELKPDKPTPIPMPTITTSAPSQPAKYWVTFSTRIRPGMRLPIQVQLFSSDTVDAADISVSLRNHSNNAIVFAQAPIQKVKAGSISVVYLDIPRKLKEPHWRSWFQYEVNVIATGDITFNQSKAVDLEEKAFSIFVQTDKAMYKPGQTVKFRALAMNPDLTIRNETMDIQIKDPSNNLLKMWHNVTGIQNTGVVEKTFPTSRESLLGDWTIEVTVMGVTETQTFTIEKYVLPKFSASVIAPKVVLTSESGIEGEACAKYTFGKPLTDAEVVVTAKCAYFSQYGNENRSEVMLTRSGQVDGNGKMPFFFSTDELKYMTIENSPYQRRMSAEKKAAFKLRYQRFLIIVNITDTRNGHKMGSSQWVRFAQLPAKLEFLTSSAETYKPGLKYKADVSVMKQDDSLFENYKNINVTFNVTMEVPLPTTTAAPTTTTSMSINATDDEDGKGARKIRPGWWGPRYPRTKTVVLTTLNRTLTETGLLQLELDIPALAESVNIEAKVLGSKNIKYVTKANSPSASYLQIQPKVHTPQVGQTAVFCIKTTEPVPKRVIYQLYSKGVMINSSEAVSVGGSRQWFNVSFRVTPNMAPNCRVLAFYLRDNGEVVADSLSIKVQPSAEEQVKVTYDRTKVKPGDDVVMTVTSHPNSAVFLLSNDKSARLLKSGNDITQRKVDEALLPFDFGSGFSPFMRVYFMCGWPFPGRGTDANSVFSDAGVAMLTDGDLYKKPVDDNVRPSFLAFGGEAESSDVATDSGPAARRGSPGGAAAKEDSAVERVRKFFPETWLFTVLHIGPDSDSVSQQLTAPDTITTWLTSAFSVHPRYGLSVMPKPAELTTFRDTFLSLDLPYSVVRNEDVCLKAHAYNYMDQPVYMGLTMAYNKDIDILRLVKKTSFNDRFLPASNARMMLASPKPVYRWIGKVEKDAVKTNTFCFRPVTLGEATLSMHLTGMNLNFQALPGDIVQRKLLVVPEGVRRSHSEPVIVDMKDNKNFHKTVPVRFPEDTVPGSQRVTVALAADLLGPMMENLGDLLRMPYGCGEQNMLHFAPNVFLIDYLQRTNTYTEKLAEKAQNFMLAGYQKELKYKHKDGSYSAFGERNNATGSMWLTSFVTKCFAQAMVLKGDVIRISPDVFRAALQFIVTSQNMNGSFCEKGRVFNKNMQGGSSSGEALTAYVLIALAESHKVIANKSDLVVERKYLETAMGRSQAYLETQLKNLTDPYDLSIVTYALHLTDSVHRETAFQRLMNHSITDPLTLHWERPKAKQEPRHFYWQRQTDAINIEMTAYALLTHILRQDMAGGLPIVRWLINQRGPQGGFISTQDTVVGLQALTQVAAALYQPHFSPMTVRVEWSSSQGKQTHTFSVDDSNKLLLHTVDLPMADGIPSTISIHGESHDSNFSGMAVAEVSCVYNVVTDTTAAVPEEDSVYALNIHVGWDQEQRGEEKKKLLMLDLKASRIDGKEGGMTLVKVGVPTGYEVILDHPSLKAEGSTMQEVEQTEDGRLQFVIYYEEMTAEEAFITVPMEAVHGIPVNTKPVAVQIVDYYETGGSQQLSKSYSLPENEDICSVAPDFDICPHLKNVGISGS